MTGEAEAAAAAAPRYHATCSTCFVTGLADAPPVACAECGSTMLLVSEVPADTPEIRCDVARWSGPRGEGP